jgi:hypothetical protein
LFYTTKSSFHQIFIFMFGLEIKILFFFVSWIFDGEDSLIWWKVPGEVQGKSDYVFCWKFFFLFPGFWSAFIVGGNWIFYWILSSLIFEIKIGKDGTCSGWNSSTSKYKILCVFCAFLCISLYVLVSFFHFYIFF